MTLYIFIPFSGQQPLPQQPLPPPQQQPQLQQPQREYQRKRRCCLCHVWNEFDDTEQVFISLLGQQPLPPPQQPPLLLLQQQPQREYAENKPSACQNSMRIYTSI